MKKPYVKPETKLIVFNLKESIAASGGVGEVGGAAIIRFTSQVDGCRGLYSNAIPVRTTGNDFIDYYNDLMTQVQQGGFFEAYFNCFKHSGI